MKSTLLFAGAAIIAGACAVAGVPLEFVLFGLTLAGVALFHHHTLQVALTGLAAITLYKLGFTGFKTGRGPRRARRAPAARVDHPHQPARPAARLRLLSNHFEESQVPAVLPRFLPDDWKGGFVLLVMVFVLSSFLDNIAAALIGGTMARRGVPQEGAHRLSRGDRGRLQRRRRRQRGRRYHHHHDVDRRRQPARGARRLRRRASWRWWSAASSPRASSSAYSPIIKDAPAGIRVDWARVGIVAFILLAAIVANVVANLRFPAVLDQFPVIGAAVWVAILLAAPLRKPDWKLLPEAFKGSRVPARAGHLRVA